MSNTVLDTNDRKYCSIWKYTENFPLKIARQFKNINNYDYTFIKQIGPWSGYITADFMLNGEVYNKPFIYYNVVSPTSCYIMDIDNPSNKEFVEDINEDERFDYWQDFAPYSTLNFTFNHNFFKLGEYYYLTKNSTICMLTDFTPTELTFEDLAEHKLHRVGIDYFAPDLPYGRYANHIRYSRYNEERIYDAYTAIFVECLNRIIKLTPINIIESKPFIDDNTLREKSIYLYDNKLCTIHFLDIENSILNLTDVHDRDNLIDVPFDKLEDLKMVLRLQNGECQTTNLPETIELQELDYFKHTRECDKIFIIYKTDDGKISSDTISSFFSDTRELIVSGIERKIKSSQLVQSFAPDYIELKDIKGNISQQKFIFNSLYYDYFVPTEIENMKNDD